MTPSTSGWRCSFCSDRQGFLDNLPTPTDRYCDLCERPIGLAEHQAALHRALLVEIGRVTDHLAALTRTPGSSAQPSASVGSSAKDLMTIPEVADFLRKKTKAVYAMSYRGQLPGVVRVGRRLLVRRRELVSSVSGSRVSSPGGFRR